MSKRNELRLKQGVARTMALLYAKNLVTPKGGNVSARLSGSNEFWITPSQQFKGGLKVRDLVKVTLGDKGSSGRLKPSVETPLHSKIYDARNDVNAVIHAHSPITLGATLAGIEIKPVTPEGVLFVGEVPVADFENPGTEDLAESVVKVIGSHSVVVMQNHGVVAIGRDLLEALNRIEVVEMTARIMTVAHVWGGRPSLTPSQLEKLKSLASA
jgi:L-ribulose-5-phosphate 4-epimerase